MSLSIGKQLKESRMKQGMTTEDIAHETRIPESSLRFLEADDYSHFPNPTYARSFLSIYSEYLEVDAEDVIEAMHGPKSSGLNSDFLKPKITLAPPNTTIPIHKNLVEQRRGWPVARFFLIIILIFLVPTIYFATQIGYRKGQLEAEEVAAATAAAAGQATDGADTETAVPKKEETSEDGASDTLNQLIGVEPIPREGRPEFTEPSAPNEFKPVEPEPQEPIVPKLIKPAPSVSGGEGTDQPEDSRQPTANRSSSSQPPTAPPPVVSAISTTSP